MDRVEADSSFNWDSKEVTDLTHFFFFLYVFKTLLSYTSMHFILSIIRHRKDKLNEFKYILNQIYLYIHYVHASNIIYFFTNPFVIQKIPHRIFELLKEISLFLVNFQPSKKKYN